MVNEKIEPNTYPFPEDVLFGITTEGRYVIKNCDKFTTIIAIVDQGSGRVSYKYDGHKIDGDKIIVTVLRDAPMIQTMDFVSWVLHLELDKEINVQTVQIVLG